MLLADEKYSALLVSPVDFTPTKKTALPSVTELEHLEVKILAFTARTFGGARAAECLRWTWDMIDRPGFETCRLGRAKGRAGRASRIGRARKREKGDVTCLWAIRFAPPCATDSGHGRSVGVQAGGGG
jgi:hypothetical protein